MARDDEEALERKYAEEALNRKAKAGIHADACTTPLKPVSYTHLDVYKRQS